MKSGKKTVMIRCPKCGCEYLPEEVFYREEMIGNVSSIIRDSEGHIIYFDGESMPLLGEYTCDKCGCAFNILGKVMFESSYNEGHSFDDEFSISISDEHECATIDDTEHSDLWGN